MIGLGFDARTASRIVLCHQIGPSISSDHMAFDLVTRRVRRPTLTMALKLFGAIIFSSATVVYAGAIRAEALIDSTLNASGQGFAAIIQWGGAGDKLTGTYDSFGVSFNKSDTDSPYSTQSNHCLIRAVVSGSTINVSLTGCSNTSVDGSYVAHDEGSSFLFTFPSSTGTLVSIKFKAGSISKYNGAVSETKLLARQGNGLATYASDNQPEQTYFAPTFSRPFKVNSKWFDVMTQQINSAPDHADSKLGAWVLQWSSGFWFRDKELAIDSFSPAGSPFPLKLGQKVTAYAIEQSWMSFSEYDVVAYLKHHWQLVSFAKDHRIKSSFIPNGATTWSIQGPIFVESVMGCIGTKHCGTVKVTYKFNRVANGGAVFTAVDQSGPPFAFTAKKS